jgi:hypothetical protein
MGDECRGDALLVGRVAGLDSKSDRLLVLISVGRGSVVGGPAGSAPVERLAQVFCVLEQFPLAADHVVEAALQIAVGALRRRR